MHFLFELEDEIESIEYVGEEDTIDIEVSGNHLFYANGILTHNSSIQEQDFDASHIAGGISKFNTADNVMAIFTSPSMRADGEYQIQFLKTRSSNGVGSKVFLRYNVETLRIIDSEKTEYQGSGISKLQSELSKKKPTNVAEGINTSTLTPSTTSNTRSQLTRDKIRNLASRANDD
jgi:hypothetical protein